MRAPMSPNRKLDRGHAVEFWAVCFSANDLEPVPCRSRRLGVRYAAHEVEQYETDLAWFVADREACGLGYMLSENEATGVNDRALWMLGIGVAPGQPFKVRVSRVTYFHDTYTGEWDSEPGDVEVVEIRAWPAERVRLAWERHYQPASRPYDAVFEFNLTALLKSTFADVPVIEYVTWNLGGLS